MGIRIIESNATDDNYAVLYCSTSMWAFGPVFNGPEQAQAFLDWIGDGKDPRLMSDSELKNYYLDFLDEEETKAEEAEAE